LALALFLFDRALSLSAASFTLLCRLFAAALGNADTLGL
jgi:hypothetical protein